MRRGGWVQLGGVAGGMVAIAILVAQAPSGRGLYPLAVIMASVVFGMFLGGAAAMWSRQRAELAFRAPLDELRFKLVHDSAADEESSWLGRTGLFRSLVAVRDVGGSPLVVVNLSNYFGRSAMELNLVATTMAPERWPDFELEEHPSAARRGLPLLKIEKDGVFSPEFDDRFKVRAAAPDALRGALSERVQRELLRLPPRATVRCRAGEIQVDRKSADPEHVLVLVEVCTAIGDLRRPPPPSPEELAAWEAPG